MRTEAILPLTPTSDHSGKEGYFVKASSGQAALVSAATDIPIGVILSGDTTSGRSSIATPAVGRTVPIKITGTSPGTIVLGTYLTVKSDGTAQADAGSGNRVRVARALEAGAANEIIEGYLIEPVALS